MVADQDDEKRARERRLAGEFQRAYADALIGGVPRAAEAVIREAIEAGLGEAAIDDLVIRPAMQVVGDLWADGHLSIAEEHLATSISMRVLTLQREAFRVARKRVSHRILLAGAQGEQHVVGLNMVASLLLEAGYDVRLFGADLPVSAVASALVAHDPAAVGFTTATVLTALHLPAAFDVVRDIRPDVGILVGGLGVDEAWAVNFGVVVCEHVADAVGQVDALVKRAGHN